MRIIFSGVLACLLALAMTGGVDAKSTCQKKDWPLWHAFETHFILDSGRVLDASTQLRHSSSEGQSYGMFFALIAGNQAKFDLMWNWSINNLSNGDARRQLPAWIWGLADDGSWRVIDTNSASDANLWYAYALLEASRLWKEPAYKEQANALLDLIEEQEVDFLPGLGAMLLPGKDWFFSSEDQTWHLNASYLPVPLLRRFALERPDGPWNEIAKNTAIMLDKTSPKGFAPDWTMYQSKQSPPSFIVDAKKGPNGSYDAIRTYLWAGMTSPKDPLFTRVLQSLNGMVEATKSDSQQLPPESVNTQTGELSRHGPFGFSAALLPYFAANNQPELLDRQYQRVRSALLQTAGLEARIDRQPPYYDYVLSLFGMGWVDNLYRFEPNGTLSLTWGAECLNTTN